MDPIIKELTEEDNYLRFKITGVNVSIINALRRIILSEIETFVFRTTPYEENKVNFEINTTRLNNELLKQRISCIPIHINDMDFPAEDYVVELDVINNSDTIIYVTSQDFKIKNIKVDKYLSIEETQKIFPPDSISGYFIDITRLRPKISDEIGGEQLKLTATLSKGTAKQNSSFNVVSTCSYGATVDDVKRNEVWTKKLKELKAAGEKDIESIKQDWNLLEGKRYIKENSFDFVIESIGQMPNMLIVSKGAEVMLEKLRAFLEVIQTQENVIIPTNTTIPHSYDILLEGEDYTLGKVIEYVLYTKHYNNNPGSSNLLTYCGFRKPHPHIDKSYIRLGFTSATTPTDIIGLLANSLSDIRNIFLKILSEFKDE
tara:strand:+ start:832 stop:1950 length:1119 start_codon:yes stop_codon:yes gene_type:complete